MLDPCLRRDDGLPHFRINSKFSADLTGNGMDIVIAQMLKREIGMADADMAKLSTGVEKMLSARPIYSRYRMVAEVIESEYCFARLKRGDKYVFTV